MYHVDIKNPREVILHYLILISSALNITLHQVSLTGINVRTAVGMRVYKKG